jgi:bacterioferritin-associated ferredoxin
VNRVYVCSCFGITEQQVRQHADDGRCTPRQIASACKAGTDCGSCVKRIQSLLGRGTVPASRQTLRVTLERAVAERTLPAAAELPVAAEPSPAELPAAAELSAAAEVPAAPPWPEAPAAWAA